ncbi:YqaA family protein [Caviibacterium pharyngocola]|uniref:VTT domain-containing protein n=1 Tax=Caviibacterium pharyngocola TaxID=28159 RepID=A0A2M8RXM3_9PAST|nr:YqaA family protein [Caviibacterium pharyngocola]PJG83632.1 hypothetical protein CVP04_03065 [Caviibacterium pharyngocola]
MSISSWDFWLEHSMWLMFGSAFLSSTVLPGNSEIIFVALGKTLSLTHGLYSSEICGLLLVATLGNTLGSVTTYWIGRCFPNYHRRIKTARAKWAAEKTQRYGALILLFGWLPIIGDVFCAVAGWLRLNAWHAAFYIALGKLVRYVFLLFLT